MPDIYRMIYFFLLSLFYISTTTRHTLENRRFLEANSNEKFCGTIRETLCECAAPSSMESYIYNIACLCVSYMSRVRICMYFRVFALCTCACLRVLRYSCVFSLLFSHSHFLSLAFLSHFPFSHPLSLPPFFAFLSRPVTYTRVHFLSFRPPFSPSLSYSLTDSACALLSSMYPDVFSIFAYFYGIELDSEEGNCAKSNETRNRSPFDLASRS